MFLRLDGVSLTQMVNLMKERPMPYTMVQQVDRKGTFFSFQDGSGMQMFHIENPTIAYFIGSLLPGCNTAFEAIKKMGVINPLEFEKNTNEVEGVPAVNMERVMSRNDGTSIILEDSNETPILSLDFSDVSDDDIDLLVGNILAIKDRRND